MRTKFISLMIGVLVVALILPMRASEEKTLSNFQERLSYALGHNFGKTLRQQEYRVVPETVIQGLMDGLTNGPSLLTEQEIREEMRKLQDILQVRQANRNKELASKNMKQGKLFLEENGKKEGVITLPDGLQYQILKEGDGVAPTVTNTVLVNYRGTLLNGAEFDSSQKQGGPVKLKVSEVIPGWREALLLMKTGAHWRLFIPSQLGYGLMGSGRLVEPNSVLNLEVELLAVE